MNYHSRNHAIKAGIAAILDFDADDIIENFALQTDQNGGIVPWFAPNLFESTFAAPRTVYVTLDGKERYDGYREWTWTFSGWTKGMLDYWRDTFAHNSTVTVREYDDINTATYLTALILNPLYGQNMTFDGAVISSVQIRFKRGVIVT